jgi:type IV pilus assembly protein PilN
MLFKINLATKIHVNTRLLRVCTLSTLILCTIVLFYNVTTISSRFGEMKSLSNKLGVMDEKVKVSGKAISEKEYTALLARIDFANSVIEKKMFTWLALLDKLETVVPDGVAISSVDPDQKGQILRLSGVGRNFKKLRLFMENLEDSKNFTEVYLMNQANANLDDGTQGVTFSLTCKAVNK